MLYPLPLTAAQLRKSRRSHIYTAAITGLGIAYVEQSIIIAIIVLGFVVVAHLAQSILFELEKRAERERELAARDYLRSLEETTEANRAAFLGRGRDGQWVRRTPVDNRAS